MTPSVQLEAHVRVDLHHQQRLNLRVRHRFRRQRVDANIAASAGLSRRGSQPAGDQPAKFQPIVRQLIDDQINGSGFTNTSTPAI